MHPTKKQKKGVGDQPAYVAGPYWCIRFRADVSRFESETTPHATNEPQSMHKSEKKKKNYEASLISTGFGCARCRWMEIPV